jgi:hypothetical protein
MEFKRLSKSATRATASNTPQRGNRHSYSAQRWTDSGHPNSTRETSARSLCYVCHKVRFVMTRLYPSLILSNHLQNSREFVPTPLDAGLHRNKRVEVPTPAASAEHQTGAHYHPTKADAGPDSHLLSYNIYGSECSGSQRIDIFLRQQNKLVGIAISAFAVH